jgi:hypothetical protein
MSWKSIRRYAAGALTVAACSALTAPASVSAVPRGFFGIFAETPATDEFDAMAAAGFGAYRVPVDWGRIQPTRHGVYELAHLDHLIETIERAGMRPVPVVFGTPLFVRAHSGDPHERIAIHPPRRRVDLAAWRRFTAALARRYGPGGKLDREASDRSYRPVRTWIIWNEQNARSNWLPRPDPVQYARLLERAHSGITGVDRGAEIALGGLFGYPRARSAISSPRYLKRLYAVPGIKRRFDAVNVHPYGSRVALSIQQIRRLRAVMRRAGDRRTAMIVGEIGWPSSVYGEDGQARRFDRFLRRVLVHRRKWRIEKVLIYAWRDSERADICLWCGHAGLITADGTPKPALTQVGEIIADATARRR